jgi:hypothetical protein
MPGPLPNPNRRRRNQPTIPTTSLPASGRAGRAPAVPKWVPLGTAGKQWWAWAWRTPQAAAWADGHVAFVARRAALEDDLAAIAAVEGLHALDLAGRNAEDVRSIVRHLASCVTGQLALVKEMREFDDRLGLTPKGMAALRWTIVDDTPDEQTVTTPTTGARRLRAVDPAMG